ncbi:MAG TPA: hypothetical protein VFI49_06415 [Rudaea sp.]|nr:hypothetical protein [Rudaea sp.]
MNILRLSFAALTLAAANVHAAGQTSQTALESVDVNGSPRLVIDCRAELLPSMRAVGAVLETNNASYIYAEREKLAHIAHRECLRGVASVAFVRDANVSIPSLAMAGEPTL